MDTKEKLQAEAEALGIDVDGRWGEQRLGEEIERAKAHGQAKEEEQEAYGNGADEADRGADDGTEGAEARSEPTDDRAGDATGDAAGAASGGDEGGSVDDGEENPAPAGGADVPAGAHAGGETAERDASPEPEKLADRTDDDAARGDAGSDPATPDDGASEPARADGDPASQGVAELAARDSDAPDQAGDASGGAEDHGDGSADGAQEPDAAALNGETDASPTFGGLPPDVAPLDDEARREAFETAREKLTGPVIGAFNAACAVAGGGGRSEGWFANEALAGDYVPVLVREAVPFVREWPTAPVEALYEHVRRAAPVLGHEEAFGDLRYTRRLAWTVFRDVLVMADAAVDEEMKRREDEDRTVPAWGQAVDPDDTMYAPSTSSTQRSDLGRARQGNGALA